jgi:hypothetical protein
MNETIALLNDAFGWQIPRKTIPKLNQRETKESYPFTKEDYNLIQHGCALDIELYQHATQLFQNQLESLQKRIEKRIKALEN